MGSITINFEGSFAPFARKTFTAYEHGHAQAVAEVINFLSGEVLPKAIALDHELQKQGEYPNEGFDKET